MTESPAALLLDRYQLTMAESYLAQGVADDRVAFELYVRELPPDRGYLLAAGLEQALAALADLRFGADVLAYLADTGICTAALCERVAGLRFDGDVDAVPEGTIVHAGEPLLRVEGGRLVCQLAESVLLNLVNFETLIATKASRVVEAAAGRPVVDFGFRRAHGPEAGVLAARAAYIGGVDATATMAAGYRFGIPTSGTMAHSYVMGFASEVDALTAFLHDRPDDATLLIDTYDPLRGAERAVEAAGRAGRPPRAVRIDSGSMAVLSRAVRGILDRGGLADTGIFVSGDLDEYRIAELLADGAPVDGFGVGTRLVTGGDVPALGGIYKLVESAGRPVMKIAGEKSTLPGRHQVYREAGVDTIALADEVLPGEPLLLPVVRRGQEVGSPPPIEHVRNRAARARNALPEGMRRLRDPDMHRPRHSPQLDLLKEQLA